MHMHFLPNSEANIVVEKSRLIHRSAGPPQDAVNPSSSSPSSSSPSLSSTKQLSDSPRTRAVIAPINRTSSSNQIKPGGTTTPTPTPGTPTIDTLTTDIGARWSKPIQSLPISTDFPRLAKLTTIFVGAEKRDVTHTVEVEDGEGEGGGDSGGSLINHETNHEPNNHRESTVEQAIYGALIKLALYLHDPSSLASTRQHFWEYHKGDIEGEVARNFGAFLKNSMQENNNVMCVLKSINQAILAPAIIALKMALSGLPFKDYRNSWRVNILIRNDDSVDVVHIRREQSFNTKDPEEMKFEFVWELCIKLSLGGSGGSGGGPPTNNPSVGNSAPPTPPPSSPTTAAVDKRVANVALQIVEVAFGPKVPPQNRDKILGDMNRLLSMNCIVTTLTT